MNKIPGMTSKEKIIADLQPLFEQAVKENLWFYCSYQGMWFSPKELREKQVAGSFIWGPSNWELRCPFELIENLKAKEKSIQREIQDAKSRILKG